MRPMKKNYILSTHATAALLATELGESEHHWETRLRNWRKPDRVSPLSWSVDTPRPKYDPDELETFIQTRQRESAALAMRSADPADDLPKVGAVHVRNDDARHMVQVSWTDLNASGVIVLAVLSAKTLLASLARAVESAEAGINEDVERLAGMDIQALDVRMKATGPDGELPNLVEAQRRLADKSPETTKTTETP